jgi:hypothetical protein
MSSGVKAVVDGRQEAAPDEEYDGKMIGAVAPRSDWQGVVREQVVRAADGEAANAADEEAGEDEDVLDGGRGVQRRETPVQQRGCDGECGGAEEVAVYVYGFVVELDQTLRGRC